MNDRPILFSAPMVRALLEGRKTQTRRLHAALGQQSFTVQTPGITLWFSTRADVS